jgi:hypothetical protein
MWQVPPELVSSTRNISLRGLQNRQASSLSSSVVKNDLFMGKWRDQLQLRAITDQRDKDLTGPINQSVLKNAL